MKNTDLNVAAPEQFAQALRNAAELFAESQSELQSAWQDDNAGRVWLELAKVCERAAAQADKACARFFK
jgi:hypothetical protein